MSENKRYRLVDLNELKKLADDYDTILDDQGKRDAVEYIIDQLSSPEETREIMLKDFENSTDCYADVLPSSPDQIIPAMTKDGFKTFINNLIKD